MKKTVKRWWVEALRSGEYDQGKDALCVEKYEPLTFNTYGTKPKLLSTRFCCLGVLCELYAQKTGKEVWEYELPNSQLEYRKLHMNHFTGILPEVVKKWAGLKHDNPCLTIDDSPIEQTVSGLNDTGATFIEIADAIEEQL